MARRVACAFVLVSLAVACAAGAAAGRAGVAAARAHAAAARMLIYAQEWKLYASRATVPAGTIDVQLWNRGQDAHDVRARRVSHGTMYGRVLAGLPVTPSGQISSGVWHLRAGHYELYCSLPGHLAMGMHFNLTVT